MGIGAAANLDRDVGAQPLQRDVFVFVLTATLGSPSADPACGMSKSDRGLGLVSLLPTGARRSKAVDFALAKQLLIGCPEPEISRLKRDTFAV